MGKVGGIHFLSLRLGFDGGARALLFSLVGLRRGWRGTVDLDGSVDNSRGDVGALDGLFKVVYSAGVILREERVAEMLWDGVPLPQCLERGDSVLQRNDLVRREGDWRLGRGRDGLVGGEGAS